MRRHTRHATVSLVSAAIIGSSLVAIPSTARAQNAPLPESPAPQAPGTPSSQIPLRASSASVTVAGQRQTAIATLPATSREFTMVGVTWKKLTGTATIQVRVRTAGGWQPWQELSTDGATASGEGRGGTEPLHVGPATAIEARVLSKPELPASVTDARISLIDSRVANGDGRKSRVQAAAVTSTGVPSRPSIVTRAGWGANESLLRYNGSGCVPAKLSNTVKAAIVHHTAGSNSYSATEAASIVRGIYSYHVKDLGWCDIGYNFLVDKYGVVYEGRHGGMEAPVRGSHASSWNTDTVGVSVMMNSSTAKQTQASMDSVARVLAWKLAGNYRNPTSKLTLAGKYINRIARHGDVMNTACPGTNIDAYMPTLRTQVASRMSGWSNSPIYKLWIQRGGENGSMGSPRLMERPWNGGRTTTFTSGAIYLTPSGSTFWMGRYADSRYRSSAGVFTALGWPTANPVTEASGTKSYVRFQRGRLWSSAAGLRMTSGGIDGWLRANPTKAAQLGYPTGEMTKVGTDVWEQRFEKGLLRYSSTGVSVRFNSTTPTPVTSSTPRVSPRMGDLDGDSRSDLLKLSATGQITWFPTTSTLKAGAARTGSNLQGGYTWVSHMPDVNGDGASELVARRKDGTLWAWNGRGRGNYVNGRMIGRTGWNGLRELTVMPDMTGDKLPEIVGINSSGALVRYDLSSQMVILRSTQIGSGWTSIRQIATVGDTRRAGVVDILAVDSLGGLYSYHGTPDGRLTGGRTKVGTGWSGFVDVHSAGDNTADGRWDLLARTSTGSLAMYRTIATGGWQRHPDMLTASLTSGVLA